MPSFVPPKKNTSFVFYTAFVDTANQPDFKANPTIASGDFKLSIDDTSGVALTANPAVVTGATTIVRFTVTAGEMNGDNINILCVDAAGGEWDDQLITIATAANLSDDLAVLISANLTAINSNAVGISANLTAINSNALGISANLTAINSNATALGILKSDTVIIRSDTLFIRSDAASILTDTGTTLPVQISANLTAINSNATALGVVKSDLVVVRSDTLFTRSEAISILADTGTTLPVQISANLTAINSNATALGILKSDTVVIRSDTLAIIADTGTTLPTQISGVLTAVNSNAVGISANLTAINSTQARLPTTLVSGRMDADMGAISTSTAAADNLEASAEIIVTGAAEAGTLSTTQMTTDLSEATDDHYNGRIVIWTSGALLGQATDITSYLGSTGELTYTEVTEAPSATDTFVIV